MNVLSKKKHKLYCKMKLKQVENNVKLLIYAHHNHAELVLFTFLIFWHNKMEQTINISPHAFSLTKSSQLLEQMQAPWDFQVAEKHIWRLFFFIEYIM